MTALTLIQKIIRTNLSTKPKLRTPNTEGQGRVEEEDHPKSGRDLSQASEDGHQPEERKESHK